MAKTIDEVFEGIEIRIAQELYDETGERLSPQWLSDVVAAELAQVKAVVEAAQTASWPSLHSISKDAETDYHERREALRTALSKLTEEQSK